MSHSYTKINIHGIFSTKNRESLIIPEIESIVYDKITEIIEKDCNSKLHVIDGDTDHVHILFTMNPSIPVTEVFKRIKGSSSHYINEQDITKHKFLWQTGFAAFSVSESQFKKVFDYIKNQKEHHKKITPEQELKAFLKNHGFIFDQGNR
jgi:REP element-mobilizing transposase RayT